MKSVKTRKIDSTGSEKWENYKITKLKAIKVEYNHIKESLELDDPVLQSREPNSTILLLFDGIWCKLAAMWGPFELGYFVLT